MVRLGSKSTAATNSLLIGKHDRVGRKWGKADWQSLNHLKFLSNQHYSNIEIAFRGYKNSAVRNEDLLIHLEFEDRIFFDAFRVPRSADGMAQVGRKGRAIGQDYLINQWRRGWNAGLFKNHPCVRQASRIWNMTPVQRRVTLTKWETEMLKEHAENLYTVGKIYNACLDDIARKNSENTTDTLRCKRIVGCTTTAAAKYTQELQAALPGVLLVEEAGEILESHVLTALGAATKQLILIGDHKYAQPNVRCLILSLTLALIRQLRPKVNNYQLTIEKGEGYDLNRSLFERLVLKGYPHQTLSKQHRMRPEISALIRELTYPDLLDAPKTQGRPELRGVQDFIVVINHNYPEDNNSQIADRRDMGSTTSKQNTHEAKMILKIVRYLGQQGYGTDTLVILTPYLGQLSKLRELLKEHNDPILNDLDSHDLISAGLLPAANTGFKKNPIRLATIGKAI
jgi:AAA domain